ncbi:hypothetical protein [Bradyrhizobium iriomotense]|uniref:Uncharacterized protein n=1 Tax=Bradyrhizobium iriomotense TaxID=441950 RepID=A0ABQ6B2W8_9BRAD|nr:hypothetical protein [Bradyrhizobium iriomotense]GLR88777.1 hypothetical protein GCM10007857_54900 [Bradyrhizobium iriomotense]
MLHMHRLVRDGAASHESFLVNAEGALLLTSFALAAIGWCCLMAMWLMRALSWASDWAT